MLWLKLKPSLIPCISQEVDKVCDLYEMIISEGQDRHKLKELSIMQASIKGRIQELDDFFDENPTSPYLPFFEKQRLKLRKLLQKTQHPTVEEPVQQIQQEEPELKPAFSTDDYVRELLNKPKKARETKREKKNEWNEVVFKIKLTRSEYNKLLKIKAQKAFRSPFV